MNRNNKNKSNKQNKQVKKQALSVDRPLQFDSTKHTRGRARYGFTSGQTVQLTRAMLLNHLVMNTASGTANYRLFTGFRLKSIHLWTAAANNNIISVEWTSTYGPSQIASDTSCGTSIPAAVHTSPPKDSLAAFWSLTGSNEADVVAIIIGPTGTFCDITYEAILQNGETPVLATTTANGTVGTVYMTYLGGVTSTGAVPASYTSLT